MRFIFKFITILATIVFFGIFSLLLAIWFVVAVFEALKALVFSLIVYIVCTPFAASLEFPDFLARPLLSVAPTMCAVQLEGIPRYKELAKATKEKNAILGPDIALKRFIKEKYLGESIKPDNDCRGLAVVYVNGVGNTWLEARGSLRDLEVAMSLRDDLSKKNGDARCAGSRRIITRLAYNNSAVNKWYAKTWFGKKPGELVDVAESVMQKNTQDLEVGRVIDAVRGGWTENASGLRQALGVAAKKIIDSYGGQPDWQEQIAVYRELISENYETVIVSHSQGNLFANDGLIVMFNEYLDTIIASKSSSRKTHSQPWSLAIGIGGAFSAKKYPAHPLADFPMGIVSVATPATFVADVNCVGLISGQCQITYEQDSVITDVRHAILAKDKTGRILKKFVPGSGGFIAAGAQLTEPMAPTHRRGIPCSDKGRCHSFREVYFAPDGLRDLIIDRIRQRDLKFQN